MAKPPGLPPSHPFRVMATWFGVGLLPVAPGTWGSLAALPLAALLTWLGGQWLLVAATMLIFALGLSASEPYAKALNQKDPDSLVIDEVAGQCLALIPAGLDPMLYLLSFGAFRLFDITKPWPANWIDRNLEGSYGIMLDDMVAGLYAAILTYGVAQWMG